VVTAVVIALLAAFVWFLNSPVPLEVADAGLGPDGVVELGVMSCHGVLSVDVYEDDSVVRVRVFDHRFRVRLAEPACMDIVSVRLREPLGDRLLIDASTGDGVDTVYP